MVLDHAVQAIAKRRHYSRSDTAWRYMIDVSGMKSVWTISIAMFLFLSSVPGHARQLDNNDPLHEYNTMLSQFWGQLYARGGSTLYCDNKFGRRKGTLINAEHVFPMSWVTRALKCGTRSQCRRNDPRFRLIETDMHNIWPARKDVNSARSNYSPAIIRGEKYVFGGCDFEVDENQRLVEPRPVVRGRIARSLFYMVDRYDLYLQPRLVKLLRQWNRAYPPDSEERRRNEAIEKLQGRRNRFIDQYTLINGITFQ